MIQTHSQLLDCQFLLSKTEAFSLTTVQYQLFGSAIITDGASGCGRLHPTGSFTAQVSWLGLQNGGQVALSLHSRNKLGELLQWLWS